MSAEPSDGALAAAYAHCADLVRDHDEDRWRAVLFAPAPARPHLHALYAFSHEIAAIPARASEPMAGEIRRQWWRDALEGAARGDVPGHPVAAALLDTRDRFRLPNAALIGLIDARAFDLYHDPMPSLAQLEGYCGETMSALLRLASIVLADGDEPGSADVAGYAGVAYAMAGLMRALPWRAREGRVFLPQDILDRHGVSRDDIVAGRGGPGVARALGELRGVARAHWMKAAAQWPALSRAARIGCLPAALTPLYLTRLASVVDPLSEIVEISPLRKMWTLWRAS
ncbi:MAG: phytoene/squalene synthase family protein [Rhizobiales bacterium 65-9]|nr:phytoene/squalene synthase family protein [Hyphomicrobiales bacterium]OJY37656.1 MAG: phytoene/squalene synthase family protein [Rhizobiales bacterium 65-9]